MGRKESRENQDRLALVDLKEKRAMLAAEEMRVKLANLVQEGQVGKMEIKEPRVTLAYLG